MAQNQQAQLQSFVPGWAVPIIQQAAQQYNVPAPVIAAMLQQESGFNINAVSSAGAQGVAQFMPTTAQAYGINPHNPVQSIDAMAHYLSNSLDALGGNLPAAIASYNAGLGAVQQYGGIPPYQETQNYVQNVMQMAGQSGQSPQQGPMQGTQPQQTPSAQQVGPISPTNVQNNAATGGVSMIGQAARPRSIPMAQGSMYQPGMGQAQTPQQGPSALQQRVAQYLQQARSGQIPTSANPQGGNASLPSFAYGPNPYAQTGTTPVTAQSIIANATTPTLPAVSAASIPASTIPQLSTGATQAPAYYTPPVAQS